MKKELLILSVLSFTVFGAVNAKCQDDAFVDLSVLGEISANNAVSDYDNVVVSVKPAENSAGSVLNLPPVEPKFPVVTAKPKAIVKKKPVVKAEKKISKPDSDKYIEVSVEKPVFKDEKPLEIKVSKDEQIIANEMKAAEDIYEGKVTSSEVAAELEKQNPVETDKISTPVEPEQVTKNEQINKQDEQLMVDLKPALVSNFVRFENEVTELSDIQKTQVEAIIKTFENPEKNRIGIISYNISGGEDAFKHKRQSLSRATEVRAFLLSKGYKNFNIKVVNVDDSSDKKNSVEIIELKK